jgi:hypothetical protein
MKVNKIIVFLFFIISWLFLFEAQAVSLTGRILLQVEDKGQAWYVNPNNNQRYYLGRPDDAYRIMKDFGLGASNKDISAFLSSSAPVRLAGRILLQVEDKGQAYYVNPLDFQLYYLGCPNDAFNVICSLGLGISNTNLAKIVIASSSETEKSAVDNIFDNLISQSLTFRYENNQQNLNLNLSPSLYENYKNSSKVLSYPVASPPPNLKESFYNLFLETKSGDTSIDEIISHLEKIAIINNWSGDKIAELVLALVQYIPYDQEKSELEKIYPYYPYETIYLNKGVCSDKTFLAYVILKRLGYGVAIIDFPDINHSVLGLACEQEYSLAGSDYCYVETTNYFPVGVIPKNISDGQAEISNYDFEALFSEDTLGKIEIYNKISGQVYQGAKEVREKAEELRILYYDITNNRPQANASYYQIINYNQKVDSFNRLLADFYQK